MRPLPRAPALLVALACAGCASGWTAVRPGPSAEGRSTPDWSRATFTVAGPPLHRWALVRVLRERYGVVDVRSGPRADGAFHLEAVASPAETGGSVLLAALSFFTFAAVPGAWSEATPLRYTLEGAGPAVAEATGRLTETNVSWAPFALLGPTLLVGMNGGVQDVGLERATAAEALAARALAAFEPAVAARLAAEAGGHR